MNIETIEYDLKCYYLTIGSKAPWENIHIRIPRFLAKLMNRKNKKYCMPDGINSKEEHEKYLKVIGIEESIKGIFKSSPTGGGQ